MALSSACLVSATNATAALPAKALLAFDPFVLGGYYGNVVVDGSYFAMDNDGSGSWELKERVGFAVGTDGGITLAAAQPNHGTDGPTVADPNGPTEPGQIDSGWEFFGSHGWHITTSALSVVTDDGAGNIALSMSGFTVHWNAGDIDMGQGADAVIACGNTCEGGDTFTLDYTAVVPSGSFAGVAYQLHLQGTITDQNQAPVATADPLTAAVPLLGSVRINLPGNMTDPDGDGVDNSSFVTSYVGGRAPTIEVCTAAAAPNALCQAAGDVIYTDTANTETLGTPDTFSYTVADTLGKVSASFDVNVTVTAAAIPPQTQPFSVLTHKDQAIDVDVLAQTTAGDNPIDPTSVNVTAQNNGSTSVDAVSGAVTFTPTPLFFGTAGFSYTVDDTLGNTSLAANVTVTVNDPPVAGNTTVSVDRNSSVPVDVVALTSDSDGTVDATTVMAVPDANGATSVDLVTGRVTYTPTFGSPTLGAAQFTYTIQDNDGGTSSPGIVTVNIVNALPVAVDDIEVIDISSVTSITIDVSANDTDSDGTVDNTTVGITANPSNGVATINAAGVITYTPAPGFVGSDTMQYTVQDNDGAVSNVATVFITVSSGSDFCQKAPLSTGSCFLQFNSGNITDGVTPVLGDGSYFTMEVQPGVPLPTALVAQNSLQLNTAQAASTSPLIPNIDQPWQFFGNLGVHQTTSAPTVKSDDGAGNIILDFNGWNVSWNQIASIPLGNGAHSGGVDGEAVMTCYSDDLATRTQGDCSAGNVYVLDFYGTVPDGDPSGFGNVKYRLHLEGAVAASGVVYGPVIAPNTTDIQAIDGAGNVVVVRSGEIAAAAGSATGTGLSAADVGVKDPQLNPNDGKQCQGGCVDFVVTGFTGDYADIIFRLNEPLDEGVIYRKLMGGVWGGFDTSGSDQLASNAEVLGACTDDQFVPGLVAGNQCIFLRIYDGGPNDADGAKNGIIVDPSGALLAGSPNTPAGSTSGCSISATEVSLSERADWILVMGFIAWLGMIGYRRNKTVNQ